MKKIYKYPTGVEVPKGAKYLNTVTQTEEPVPGTGLWSPCFYVWHYYEVEIDE